jgi:uncharacterized iron-regulated protein
VKWFFSRSLLFAVFGCAAFLLPCFAGEDPRPALPQAVDLKTLLSFEALAGQLSSKRVVFVGETHDRYDHHLNQLEIIRRLHEIGPGLAVGIEYIQQPFQPFLDDYIAGRIDEREFLRATEYYERWRYDFRLLAPIFRFAREQGIPMIALNVPRELTRAVSKAGVDGITGKDREYLPKEIDRSDKEYEERLRKVYEQHPGSNAAGFDRFVEAQLVWDEGMAERAATYLNANPGSRMVILAGSGHLEFGSGIPNRLERRINTEYAIVLSSAGDGIESGMARYLLFSTKQDLPPAGVLGVNLEDKEGEIRIGSVNPGSAAEKAGLKKGDAISAINGEAVKRVSDVRVSLWDKEPGDRVQVTVHRKGRSRAGRDVEVALAAPIKPAGHP